MPNRIQRQRTKGWRMPPGAIYVGRPGRWGNPYLPGCTCEFGGAFLPPVASGDWERELRHPQLRQVCQDVADAVRRYAELLARCRPAINPDLEKLRGHDLACWCPLTDPCHADVLLELANG